MNIDKVSKSYIHNINYIIKLTRKYDMVKELVANYNTGTYMDIPIKDIITIHRLTNTRTPYYYIDGIGIYDLFNNTVKKPLNSGKLYITITKPPYKILLPYTKTHILLSIGIYDIYKIHDIIYPKPDNNPTLHITKVNNSYQLLPIDNHIYYTYKDTHPELVYNLTTPIDPKYSIGKLVRDGYNTYKYIDKLYSKELYHPLIVYTNGTVIDTVTGKTLRHIHEYGRDVVRVHYRVTPNNTSSITLARLLYIAFINPKPPRRAKIDFKDGIHNFTHLRINSKYKK